MAEIIKMPRLSDTMTDGVVAKWHKKIGDKINEGDLLADIETDKATLEFESFQEGYLLHIGVQEKETAAVGMGNPKGSGVDPDKRITTISWIPFKEMPEMYRDIEKTMLQANNNHFGFEGMQLTEPGQFTHYLTGGFYEWHMDNDVMGKHQPPVRKISMTLLLSDPANHQSYS